MNLCSQCNNNLPTKFVKCHGCNSLFHFSSCCPISEKTYGTMSTEKKSEWRCTKCKPRKNSTSSNNLYISVFDESPSQNQQKQLRECETAENDPKRFKDSLSLNEINNSVFAVKRELKTEMTEIKQTIQQLTTTIAENNAQMNANLQAALATITNSLNSLTSQVSQLCEKNQKQEKQINEMDARINNLEQQQLNRNIEIKNITNTNISPNDVVKTIAKSLNIEISDSDISNSYSLKKSEKVIIEFSSLGKKRELLSKINRHRVDSSLINSDNKHKYIFVNEHLTLHKRRLLWTAKTKAKETNWKFIWIRNGNIYAKKNENSSPIAINNASDIELIASTI